MSQIQSPQPAPEDVVWDLPGESPVRISLLVLPHAGGNAHTYAEWRQHLPQDVRLLIGQYPGRGARYSEPLPESIDDLAAPVAAALPADVGALVVLGHSMGSLVAFEVARALEDAGRPPRMLVASACRAPVLANPSVVGPERLNDDELVAAIKERGGTDHAILDEPQLREVVLPAIRADFAIDDVYRCAPERAHVSCPVAVLGGDDDPIVPAEALARWSDITDRGFSIRTFPGGHFYFQGQLGSFAEALADVITVAAAQSQMA